MGVEDLLDAEATMIVKGLNEYKQKLIDFNNKINQELETEWENKKFKWFFPKYRRNKLWHKIFHKYDHPIFELIEETIELVLPKMQDAFINGFADIKDIGV